MYKMKTKKEIFWWWLDRGEELEDKNDYQNFWKRIDRKLKISEEKEGNEIIVKIKSDAWKYPVYLYFRDLECYRISGF